MRRCEEAGKNASMCTTMVLKIAPRRYRLLVSAGLIAQMRLQMRMSAIGNEMMSVKVRSMTPVIASESTGVGATYGSSKQWQLECYTSTTFSYVRCLCGGRRRSTGRACAGAFAFSSNHHVLRSLMCPSASVNPLWESHDYMALGTAEAV